MGLGHSVEMLGSQLVDEKTVKEGLAIAIGYIALKAVYVSLTKDDGPLGPFGGG